jgi:hypothetical protein
MLLVGIFALALAVFIATQVIGVLYAIVFPPAPPLPDKTTVISHKNIAYGVDDWEYGTDQDACRVVQFYAEKGGACRAAPFQCAPNPSPDDLTPGQNTEGQHVARCVGQTQFSVFAMRWEAIIAANYQAQGKTHFRLTREVYWTGAVPPQPAQQGELP